VAPRSPQTMRKKSIFDTALTQRFESARRLSPITLSKRIYMFHCHILEHETAMMLNLKVV
jgi:FtsP/CotA-like multicopper oxidase with cupredoxin domain